MLPIANQKPANSALFFGNWVSSFPTANRRMPEINIIKPVTPLKTPDTINPVP